MDESKPNRKKDKELILRKTYYIAAIAASAITIITGVLAIGNYVPKVLFQAFLLLTVLIVLVLLVYMFARVARKWKEARKNKALVRKYFDDFATLSDRLAELLKDNRSDNIPYIFTNLSNMPGEFSNLRSLMYDIGDLFAVLKDEARKLPTGNFRVLITWFGYIVRLYNKHLVLQPFQQIRNLHRDKLTEHDREAYEKSRERYVRFLQDYENFAKAINKDCGENITHHYFEPPGRLEKA